MSTMQIHSSTKQAVLAALIKEGSSQHCKVEQQ